MKASIEQITPVKKRLTVEIDAEEVDRKIEDAYKELKKRAKVDGFRPGKVPRNILQRHFGDQVTQDVKRGLLSESLPQAFEETEDIPCCYAGHRERIAEGWRGIQIRRSHGGAARV